MHASAYAVTRPTSTVYVVRIIHDEGMPQQRTRVVTGSDGRARIWFDRDAAAAHAADWASARTPDPAPLFG